MAYTRPWDPPTVLLGARDADEIDDAVRDFARDVDERLDTILVDPTEDPVRLFARNVSVWKHWSAADIETDGAHTFVDGFLYPSATTKYVIARFSIDLPPSSILNAIFFRFLKTTVGAGVTVELFEFDNLGIATLISPSFVAADSPSVQGVDLPSLNWPIVLDRTYMLKVTLQADAVAGANCRLLSVGWNADIKMSAV